MNRAESKYFNTAVRMDEAFLKLLEKKDLAYITVKELCEEAGVNRSTFYLHYETLGDLLAESIQYMNDKFSAHMKCESDGLAFKIGECPLEELYLVTPKYLTLYLTYIMQNKRLFRTALDHADSFHLDKTYQTMFCNLFQPILKRFQVENQDQHYIMAFYIHGLMAIVTEWLKKDCSDSIAHISAIMEQCVMGSRRIESGNAIGASSAEPHIAE